VFSPFNKIHREVGRAKDLSAPRYNAGFHILRSGSYNHQSSKQQKHTILSKF